MNEAAAVVTMAPTQEWARLPGPERLKWLRDEAAALREQGYGAMQVAPSGLRTCEALAVRSSCLCFGTSSARRRLTG